MLGPITISYRYVYNVLSSTSLVARRIDADCRLVITLWVNFGLIVFDLMIALSKCYCYGDIFWVLTNTKRTKFIHFNVFIYANLLTFLWSGI